jgi:hypothetical protein
VMGSGPIGDCGIIGLGPDVQLYPEEKDSMTSSPWLMSSFPAIELVRSLSPSCQTGDSEVLKVGRGPLLSL